MTIRTRRLMVLVAAVCAVVTASGLYRLFSNPRMVEAQGLPEIPTVVAVSDLSRGAVLGIEQLRVEPLRANHVPQGAFREVPSVVGRAVKQPILAGAPVTEGALASPNSLLEARLAQGYRAVGVFVDGRGGLQKYLQPGDRVDVVVTAEDAHAGSAAKMLLQDIEVLEIPEREGSSTYQDVQSWMSVILAVTPPDAERLALAMHVGTVQLIGRGIHDMQVQGTSGVTRDTLLPQERGGSGSSASFGPTYRSVEVIRGGARVQERFSFGPNGWAERPEARASAKEGP